MSSVRTKTPVEVAAAPSRAMQMASVLADRMHQFRLVKEDPFPDKKYLDSGNFGVAYTAKSREKEVLVKELSCRLIPGMEVMDFEHLESVVSAFNKEAAILRNLRHPCIPAYIDSYAREVEGELRLYLVQEYVPGKSIEQHVKDGTPFTQERALEMTKNLLFTLQFLQLHSPPIYHRDITPSNVHLGDDGKTHLIDFGVSSMEKPGTVGATIVGTPGYAAPEQISEGRHSEASENYGVAATLVMVLTRKDIAKMEKENGRPKWRQYANVSEELADWIDRMLDPEPENRPANAQIAMEELFAHGNQDAIVPKGKRVFKKLIEAGEAEEAMLKAKMEEIKEAMVGLYELYKGRINQNYFHEEYGSFSISCDRSQRIRRFELTLNTHGFSIRIKKGLFGDYYLWCQDGNDPFHSLKSFVKLRFSEKKDNTYAGTSYSNRDKWNALESLPRRIEEALEKGLLI